MRNLLMGLACAAMVMGSQVFAQNAAKEQTGQAKNQKGQQQTVRGTVVGVTSVGEAMIDPQTNTAVVVEKDYLTVLGSAMGQGQRGQRDRTRGNQPDFNRTERKPSADIQGDAQDNQADASDQQRQNLYLVAITPQTKVHKQMGRRGVDEQPGQEQAQDQQQSRQNFEQLEIGDRVMVRFSSTEQLQAKTQDGKERTAGFRGDPKSQKHGRHRIVVGEASEIAIMGGQAGQRGQGQARDRQSDRPRRNVTPDARESRE